MVKNIALTLFRAAYSMSTTPNDDVDLMFTNVPIKFKVLAMSQIEWDTYLLGEVYQHDVVRECITQIGAKFLARTTQEAMLIFTYGVKSAR